MSENELDPDVGSRNWSRLWSVGAGRLDNSPLAWRTDTQQRPTDEWLAANGFYQYVDPGPPEHNPVTHYTSALQIPVIDHEAKTATRVYDVIIIPQSVLREGVNAERDRRIQSGFTFNGVRFQTRPDDQKRIAGVGTMALGAMVNGAQAGDLRWADPDSDFAWIAEDNTEVTMDAQTAFAFGLAYAAWERAHIFAARAIKELELIPEDYADDSHWPAVV